MQLDDFLLTATGILLAVLSLWALLWVSFTRGGEDVDSKKRAATIGLFWIYCSIAIAVVAFGLLLASKLFGCGCPASHARRIGEGFLSASFAMAATSVLQSLVSIAVKASRGKTAFDVMFECPEGQYRWSPLAITVIGVLLAAFCVLAVYYDRLFLVGGAVIVITVFAYYIYKVIRSGY
ncbi:MAG TPA: hypothetical protein G4O13_06695 [Dehalococcoidia bacterium]|nr:hypothetical protein [Dehalococcoidia bacterium]